MPELPEVGILKEELRREVVGRRVEVLGVFVKKEGEFPVAQLREAVEGRAIVEVRLRDTLREGRGRRAGDLFLSPMPSILSIFVLVRFLPIALFVILVQ